MIKNKVVYTTLAVVVGIISLIIYSSVTRLKLVDTQPKSGATGVVISTVITFTFNQDMDSSSMANTNGDTKNVITIVPVTAGKVETRSKSIIFTPDQSLLGGQVYTVTLSGIMSAKGRTVPDARTAFTTENKALNEKEAALIKTLPYTGKDFVVDYVASSKTITIRIYADPATTKKQEAYDYIRSFGIDPDEEPIDIFLGPDVTGGSSGP